MSSRNIAVRKDVYDALQREKRPQESFTQLFVRLMEEKPPLTHALGAWGSVDRRRVGRVLRAARGTGPEDRR